MHIVIISLIGVMLLSSRISTQNTDINPRDYFISELKRSSLPVPSDSLRFEIINGLEGMFGYDIYYNQRRIIHQTTAPCQAGNLGFLKRSDARKVALLVINKMRNGQMPPSISLNELERLGVVS